jgi:hypothetical protein
MSSGIIQKLRYPKLGNCPHKNVLQWRVAMHKWARIYALGREMIMLAENLEIVPLPT